jgi:hypothetical protein
LGPLVHQREPQQKTIQGFFAAIKTVQGVAGLQGLDP